MTTQEKYSRVRDFVSMIQKSQWTCLAGMWYSKAIHFCGRLFFLFILFFTLCGFRERPSIANVSRDILLNVSPNIYSCTRASMLAWHIFCAFEPSIACPVSTSTVVDSRRANCNFVQFRRQAHCSLANFTTKFRW